MLKEPVFNLSWETNELWVQDMRNCHTYEWLFTKILYLQRKKTDKTYKVSSSGKQDVFASEGRVLWEMLYLF